jgi:hypothetical protein
MYKMLNLPMDNVLMLYEHTITVYVRPIATIVNDAGFAVQGYPIEYQIRGLVNVTRSGKRTGKEGAYPSATYTLNVRSEALNDAGIDKLSYDDWLLWNDEKYIVNSYDGLDPFTQVQKYTLTRAQENDEVRR